MENAEALKIYLWITSGVSGFMLTVFVIMIPIVARNLGNKFQRLTDSIEKLNESSTRYYEQIGNLQQKEREQDKRLNNYSNRLHKLEIKTK